MSETTTGFEPIEVKLTRERLADVVEGWVIEADGIEIEGDERNLIESVIDALDELGLLVRHDKEEAKP